MKEANSDFLYLLIPDNSCATCIRETINSLKEIKSSSSLKIIVPTGELKMAKIRMKDIKHLDITYDTANLAYKYSISKSFPTFYFKNIGANEWASLELYGKNIDAILDSVKKKINQHESTFCEEQPGVQKN